ncbi:TPA: hypothetical protein DCQ44_00035 [Candidatus Taylorbacteria bacterium]|nr:hypothetical protein [Candidatus Taylorbacteria bacterium]
MIYSIKPYFQKTLIPARDLCLKIHVTPTIINIKGVIASIVIALAIVFYPQWPVLIFLIPIFALIRTALNALDGMVARELAVSSSMGEVLNEFLDRCSDAIIFGAFIFVPSINVFLVVLTVVLVILVSYVGILSKAVGASRMYAGVMGKADRMFYLGAYAILAYFFPNVLSWDYFLIVITVGAVATLIERLVRINHILKRS